MENAKRFSDKIRSGQVCLGTAISCFDPTVTEALCNIFDFVWIDMEHNALSLESVQAHVMATKGTDTTPLVRVAWNDPVLVKPVLDIGAAGVIFPMIRTADEAARAVAACCYPPEGLRGFGPRRANNYGRVEEAAYCRQANDCLVVIVQIENMDAVRNLEEILMVPRLTGIVVGPADLSLSMGYVGQRNHPEVVRTISDIIARARQREVLTGVASGDDPEMVVHWIEQGAQWISVGNDISLMLRTADHLTRWVRAKAATS